MFNISQRLSAALLAAILFSGAASLGTPKSIQAAEPLVAAHPAVDTVRHRKIEIQGIEIAYREAGDPANSAIVLLHGFPTSSHMFRELIPILAKRHHVIAPDYPGFGASEQPGLDAFDYSFANFADVIDAFLQAKAIDRYALYLMDYGAPVGFRVFAKHPERVTGLVIQNGNAYKEGLKAFWEPLKTYWADPSDENGAKLRPFFELDATIWQYTHGVPEDALELVSPDNWHHDQHLLDRPGNKDIQLKLFLSYGTNVPEYANWQQLFRAFQPPALIMWGQGDHIFPPDGAHAYERDLENVEKHLLDTGHFALETHLEFMAARILAFLDRSST